MDARLTRVILYVQDVERLAAFCRDALGLAVVEAIAGEWAVLKAGACGVSMGASSPIRPSPAAVRRHRPGRQRVPTGAVGRLAGTRPL